MRVDLRLQRIHLRAALLLLLHHDVIHEDIHLLQRRLQSLPQMLHLGRTADIDFLGRDLPGCLLRTLLQYRSRLRIQHAGGIQLPDRIRKPHEGIGNAKGNELVHQQQNQKGNGHQHHHKIAHAAVAEEGLRVPQYRHQLPARISHGIHDDGTLSSLIIFFMRTVLIVHNDGIVFGADAVQNLHVAGMIHQLPVLVRQVIVNLCRVLIQTAQHLFNAGIVHVYQQNAGICASLPVQLHHAAQRNDPVIAIGAVIKDILHMRPGIMKILYLSHGLLKPALLPHVPPRLPVRNRCRRQEASVRGEQGNADEAVLMGFIHEVHLAVDTVLGKILVLNDIIVHGIGDPPHADEAALDVLRGSAQQLLRALDRVFLNPAGELPIQDHRQEQGQHHRHHREADENQTMYGSGIAPSLP